MKNFLILLFSGIPCILGAQHNLQSHLNMFRANDLIFKQQVEYKDPGRSGANVLWDFSQLDVVNENKGNHEAGTYHFEVDMSHLPTDNYALTIGLSDKKIQEVVMKR